MFGYDSDYDYDSEESSGEPYLTLLEEVRRGDINKVREALDSGANPNDCDSSRGNYTLLHWAVGMTDPDGSSEVGANKFGRRIRTRRQIVRLLLDSGAQAWPIWWQDNFLDEDGQRVWDMTEDQDTLNMVLNACVAQALDAQTYDSERRHNAITMADSGLCAAALLNQVDNIAAFVTLGADPNEDTCGYTPLKLAAGCGHLEAVKALVEDHEAALEDSLCVAAHSDHEEVMHYLIQARAEVFIDDVSSISEASKAILFEAMTTKIPEILACDQAWNQRCYVKTAFRSFIQSGYMPGLNVLLEAGVMIPSDSLAQATAFGQKEVLEHLIAMGALRTYDPNKKVNWYGCSTMEPPHSAVKECQEILDQTVAAAQEFDRLATHE